MDEPIKRDLTSFTKAIGDMIAKNESSYNLATRYGRSRYERTKDYTLEEIKCNKSKFLYNSMIAMIMIIFILF